jgi:RNA polymerase sigma-70 factor, ECF subfamily
VSKDTRRDSELLAAVADGDAGALRTLYRRHAPWLSVRLHRRCNDAEVVADVLQDTFLAAWKGASRYRGEGEVAAWLWGIGLRRLISQMRRHHRSEVSLTLGDWVEPAVEDAVLLGVEYGRLGNALASLSPEMRAVIQATVLDGLTVREASRLLAVPEGTIKTRAMRARAHLREFLVEGAT